MLTESVIHFLSFAAVEWIIFLLAEHNFIVSQTLVVIYNP
ncbi:hypothetical protein C900_04302 [Fulvivirga imtechensis AK7]|uniref:Uncharacterized protein n=1 Tax=Fulvivirga imtechensis AK7 TaxID=1237149 RepID=L8JXC9_9BACT|nr:hypothetical protein C900_04302 [Fulvivirga imtechensis AK7]